MQEFFARAHGELEDMLHDTTRLLSDLTHYAALVVPPARDAETVRSVQLVGLGGTVALAVIILSDGSVQKAMVELEPAAGDERLAAAGVHLAAHLVGRPWPGEVSVPPTGDAPTDRLAERAQEALRQAGSAESDQLFVRGAAQMANTFDAIETVRRVLAILEQQYVIVGLLRQAIHDDRLTVSIGAEHGVEPLAQCSIVVAPYVYEGAHVGTIGVLGPTRMNYPQAIAAVGVVSQRLSRALRGESH